MPPTGRFMPPRPPGATAASSPPCRRWRWRWRLSYAQSFRGDAKASNPESRDSGSGANAPSRNDDDSALALTSLPEILLHVRAQTVAQVGAGHAEGDVGAQEAGLGAAIMALA